MKISDFDYKASYKKKLILIIKRRRKKGATFQEISNEFNEKGYETLKRCGKWHPQTIHRFLIPTKSKKPR